MADIESEQETLPTNKEIAATIKAKGKQRLAEQQNRLTGLIPIDGEDASDAWDAEQMLEQARKEEEAARKARAEAEAGTYIYYVKCHQDHGKHPPHGVYLDANPLGGDVPADGWRARYRPDRKQPWYEDIVCQVCLWQRGEMVPLEVAKTSKGRFTVNWRYLWRRPKDAKRAQIEGETLANEGPYTSTNAGRTEALERAKAAGYEVL